MPAKVVTSNCLQKSQVWDIQVVCLTKVINFMKYRWILLSMWTDEPQINSETNRSRDHVEDDQKSQIHSSIGHGGCMVPRENPKTTKGNQGDTGLLMTRGICFCKKGKGCKHGGIFLLPKFVIHFIAQYTPPCLFRSHTQEHLRTEWLLLCFSSTSPEKNSFKKQGKRATEGAHCLVLGKSALYIRSRKCSRLFFQIIFLSLQQELERWLRG